ncbi:MAG: helix-turn-helix domain-containing protein [Treponema sp.]|jgi:AraC family transcriptional regulator|nr:helix-turn-helix domain-containing protein [Treponema sp.]
MQKPYNVLENVLNDIENRINEDINADILAENLGLSSIHLQRLFKFAFKQPLGSYIRSRKLAASLDILLNTNSKLINIALDYGFGYEQTYIRAFKREYGVTPGAVRKSIHIVKVTPPLNLLGAKLFDDGIMLKPEIVMLPQFHLIGRKHQMPLKESTIYLAPKKAKHFWENDRKKIPNIANHNVYIGLTRTGGIDADYNWYMPSVHVKSLKHIPEGLEGYTFKPALCAMFRYIGQHHYYDINRNRAKSMYSAIEKFFDCEYGHEFYKSINIFFEKVDTSYYDGNICQMEWFAPIKKPK